MICNICNRDTGTLFKRNKLEYGDETKGYGIDCHNTNSNHVGADGYSKNRNPYVYPENRG